MTPEDITVLKTAWIGGVILSMIMFWRIDRHNEKEHKSVKMGFIYSLFLSLLLGIAVGWGYLVFLIFASIDSLWDSSIKVKDG
jgi:hypothetical protein